MSFHPFQDFWLKGAAVSLAVLLWLSIGGDPVVERGLEVPLELQNLPTGLDIVGDLPDSVSVRVRGSSAVVGRLGTGSVVAVLDLSNEHPGRRLFDMFADRVNVPSGIEVTSVVPATVALTLERAGEPRTVPVVPDIDGEPAPGLAIGRIRTVPSTVSVIGPETRLAMLSEATTEPVSVAAATGDVVTEVTVGVTDPTLRPVQPVTARVEVEIVPAPVERTIHDVPVVIRDDDGSGWSAAVTPARVTVGVRGARSEMRDLDDETIQAFVNLSVLAGVAPGRYNLPVAVDTHGDLRVTLIDPSSVDVAVQ